MRRGATAVVVNLESSMTGDFTRAPDLAFPGERLRQAIVDAAGPSAASFLDAGRLARALVGDAIGANLLLVGYAWQKGLIPLSRGAIERVTQKVFLLSPPNVTVAAEDKQRIAENGFFNQS